MTSEVKKIIQDSLDERMQREPGREAWSMDLFLDRRDLEMDESTAKTIARSDDPRGMFYELTSEAYQDSQWREENVINSFVAGNLESAGLEYDEDELYEYIREHVDICIPTDEILSENKVCVNIIVDTGDANYEFTKNSFAHSYYGDGEGIDDESSLLWLAEQQGASAADLRRAFLEGTAFDAEIVKSKAECEAASKVLEGFGKRYSNGYRNDPHQGLYRQLKQIQGEITKCTVQISHAEKSLSEVPATYDDYLKACDERGIQIRMSEESFTFKRKEIVEKAEERIRTNKDQISALKEEIIEKKLEPVLEADEAYQSSMCKYMELIDRDIEGYERCRMLNSLIESSASTTSGMNALTFCVEMSLSDYLDLREAMDREKSLNKSADPEERTGTGEIILSSKTHAILYDAWSGAGSCADVKLCTDVHLPIRLIDSANPDGMDGYGVKEIYGVDSSFYSDTLVGICPMKEREKTPLEEKINDARAKSAEFGLEANREQERGDQR